MDPWQYDADFLAAADCHRPRSHRKSASSHPSQRFSERHPRPSRLSDSRRWKLYPKFLDRKLSRRRQQRHDFFPRTVIPDRLQDAFVASDPHNQPHAQPEHLHPNAPQHPQTAHLLLPYTPIRDNSVLTAVTAESATDLHHDLSRRRADSEPARRRSLSFLSRRDSVFSLWDRFWKRRRTTQAARAPPATTESHSSASRTSGKLSRLRKLDFRLTSRSAV
ncbi:hypothetical protein BWQ96_06824 [Gracilariopsis chorda]|uniref:Uncharacterized protein n=1 Tax=Gracilariopsis chorda TaxID=448386 RepID=A0A2V3IMX2_9FLOR|nr:hypothetical protein BWQ96_06824 [Gracilariopsis chorda]|eukprot:PXF43434.1 hypothetical protein BWQ96_06824 [Gracilariopsis chorda]